MKNKSFIYNIEEPLNKGPYVKILTQQYNLKYENSFAVSRDYQMKQSGLKDMESNSLVVFYNENDFTENATEIIEKQISEIKKEIFSKLKTVIENTQILKENSNNNNNN